MSATARSTKEVVAFAPLMMERVDKVYIECALNLGVENGKPVTTFFFKLGGNTEWVEFVQKAAVLAYRSKRRRVVHGGALWKGWLIRWQRRWSSSGSRNTASASEGRRGGRRWR
jgi:hypothetical protein